jgi:hypothetical protein
LAGFQAGLEVDALPQSGVDQCNDRAIACARAYQLTPGVALSAEQMALLTTDIVWLNTTDIQNHDHYQATSVSVSVGSGMGSSGKPGFAPGIGSASGSQGSTTKSGISQGAIALADGSTAPASLDRSVMTDRNTSGALKKTWNGQALLTDVQAQSQVMQTALPQIANEIGNYAVSRTQPLDEANTYLAVKDRADKGLAGKTELAWLAQMEGKGYTAARANATLADPQAQSDYANWKEGGAARVAAHAALGALAGGVQGALGAGASAAATPVLAEQIDKLDTSTTVNQALLTAAGAAVGGITGGTAGAVTGGNQVANNFLKHDQVGQMKKDLAACNSQPKGCSDDEQKAIVDKYLALSSANIAAVQGCIRSGNADCVQKLEGEAAMAADVGGIMPLGYGNVEAMLDARQTNAVSGSVYSSRNPLGTDAQLAQQVAQFRQANCADLSSSACDAKVVEAMKSTQLKALGTVGATLAAGPVAAVATKGPAAVAAVSNAARGCASDVVLCANTVGIVVADAAADGAIGSGAVAAVAPKTATSVDAAGTQAKTAKTAGSGYLPATPAAAPAAPVVSAPAYVKIEDLYDKPLPLIQLSHTSGPQAGKLGEQLAIQVLNEKTGLNFQPLQNVSGHGCDGCAISIQGDTITVVVMDAKSSQAGVDAAKSATGNPAARLNGWIRSDSIKDASLENKTLIDAIQAALDKGAQVQGITVKVGLPAPGTTGIAELKVEPWPKKK